MAKIVILGGGLTGLSTAYHLEQQGFYDYVLFEQESTIGGLCSSVRQDGFTFDATGHLLHASDTYFRSFIEHTAGLQRFNVIDRRSAIYSHATYTPYPYQMNLFGLPPAVISDCIEGFITRKKKVPKHASFYEWVDHHFGKGFGNHFFYPYQHKIFAYNLEKITANWVQKFIPPTSLRQILKGALSDNPEPNIGYNAHFFYPKHGGIHSWIQSIAEHIHNPIQTNFCVQSVDIKHKLITFTNGHSQSYDQLITTIPLDKLLRCMHDRPSSFFAQAAEALRCNSVINFNLGIKRANLSHYHWVYFPEKQYPFYRLGFPHNLAHSMAPEHHSSISGEFSYLRASSATIDARIKQSIIAVQKLFTIHDEEIVTKKIIPIKHAYVIYDFWREKNLRKLLGRLAQESIHSIGRYGAWKYSSMQDAVLDGKKIAATVLVMPAHQTDYSSSITIRHKSARSAHTHD